MLARQYLGLLLMQASLAVAATTLTVMFIPFEVRLPTIVIGTIWVAFGLVSAFWFRK